MTLINQLKAFKIKQSKQKLLYSDIWEDKESIFVHELGKPVSPNTISNWFRKFISKNELPYITFHGLRHTSATLLISYGFDIKTVSTRLGHSEIGITLNTYTHALQKTDKEASDKLENMYLKEAASCY